MSTESNSRPPALATGRLVRGGPSPGETADSAAEVGHHSQPTGDGRTSQAEPVAVKRQHEPRWRRFASPARRRVGSVEYALLALIALGVAITVVMAIVNP
jgi:hypothetical protein